MTTVLRSALTGQVAFAILAVAGTLSATSPVAAGGRVAIPNSEFKRPVVPSSVEPIAPPARSPRIRSSGREQEAAVATTTGLAIEAATGAPAELETKAQLEALLARYDLSRWAFTDRIFVDQRSIPHSHPVLTLHTRHLLDDDLLLSTYLHEQLHWWLASQPEQTSAALADVRQAFPNLPVGYPQGSDDSAGNDLHILVTYLEWQAVIAVVGELRARQIMEFWADDHYTHVYRAVLERPDLVRGIVRRHALSPRGAAALAPSDSAASVIRAKFDAVNRHDIDQIVAAYAETATLTATDFCAPRLGRSEVRRTYRDIFSAVPDVRAEIVELLVDGNRVAVQLRLRGTVAGQPFALSLMNFFTVADGLITRDDGIFDNGGRTCRP